MRTTIHPVPVGRPAPAGGGPLRRLLAHRPGRAATPSRPAGGPRVRRVWREVAPGEWRWLHLPDQEQPR